jgi:hypothetical protein
MHRYLNKFVMSHSPFDTAVSSYENKVTLEELFWGGYFQAALNQGATLNGYISCEYIKDYGTPKRLDKVCADFSLGRVGRSNLALPQVAVFL